MNKIINEKRYFSEKKDFIETLLKFLKVMTKKTPMTAADMFKEVITTLQKASIEEQEYLEIQDVAIISLLESINYLYVLKDYRTDDTTNMMLKIKHNIHEIIEIIEKYYIN